MSDGKRQIPLICGILKTKQTRRTNSQRQTTDWWLSTGKTFGGEHDIVHTDVEL